MEDIQVNTKFWQSSNFWTAVVLLAGGFFIGFPEETGSEGVNLVFMLLAVGKTLRNFFKNSVSEWRKWINDANFWNYFTVIAVSIVPTLPDGTVEAVQQIATNLVGANWQGVIIGVFSLATILYKIFTTPKEATSAA